MVWQQISLRVAAADVPRIEALLRVAGAQSIAAADAGSEPLLEPPPGETPLWPEVLLKALFPAGIDLRRVAALLPADCLCGAPPAIEDVAEADWINAWREEVAPCEIAGRLRLAAADEPHGNDGVAELRLHMGLAFGTGRHPTTRLCLAWIAEHAAAHERVLDFGCGSGVLALAALRLGARYAWAVDIDAQALAATCENARLNDLQRQIWIGRPEDLPALEADLVVANILADPLTRLAARFADRLQADGTIVLSGLLEEQLRDIRAAYAPYFGEFAVAVESGWMRIVARRLRQ